MKSQKKSSVKIRLPHYKDIVSVAKECKVNGSSLLVLIYLLTRVNTTRSKLTCWPSQATIIEDTGLNERTVIRALNNLERLKLIRAGKHSPTGNLNEYEVLQWWSKVQGSPRQKCRYDPDKSTGIVPDNSTGYHPDKNACLESYKENLSKLNHQIESSSPSPLRKGVTEEEDSKTFFQDPGPDQQNDSDLEVGGQMARRADGGEAPLSKVELIKLPFDDMTIAKRKRVLERELSFMKSSDPGLMENLKEFLQEKMEEAKRQPGRSKPILHPTAYKLQIIYHILTGLQEKEFTEWRESRCSRRRVNVVSINF